MAVVGVDSTSFRNALGRFASGVTVVTARRPDGRPIGVTVSAFSSLSLDPPLILICLDRATTDLEVYRAPGCPFAVNILAADQSGVALAFATGRDDKFAAVRCLDDDHGAPLLDGCVATIQCRTEAEHPGGDHLIIVGRVTALSWAEDQRPLLYFRGRFGCPDR